jgi:hypothetical protein
MLSAFVFLNCDIGAEKGIIQEMNGISGVSEAVRVSGVYDIVAKVSDESREKISILVKKIRAIASIRSSLTMVVASENAPKHLEVV